MARKVFLSFLGAGKYKPCQYYLNKDEYIETRFIQEAILSLYCKNWDANDIGYIFLTDLAKSTNWIDNKHLTGLDKLIKELELPFKVYPVDIPSGSEKNYSAQQIQNEIWIIFDTVFKKIQPNDHIYLDITHAFRFIPMLGLLLLNYAKFLKKINVDKILYGAFEVIGSPSEIDMLPMNKRNAPIVDLTNLSELQDLTAAADIFVNFGNAKRLVDLTQNTNMHTTAINMQDAMRLFSTVRGKEIIKGLKIDKLKAEIKKLNKELKTDISHTAFEPLVEHLQLSLKNYRQNSPLNGFLGVKFCIENELIQQAYTLLQESILSYLIFKEEEKFENKLTRNVLSSCLLVAEVDYRSRLSSAEENNDVLISKEKELKNKFYKSFTVKLFADIYSNLTDPRNDLMHGGMKGNSETDAEHFIAIIIGIYNDVADVINQLEKKNILSFLSNEKENIYYDYKVIKLKEKIKSFEVKYKTTFKDFETDILRNHEDDWGLVSELHEWEKTITLYETYSNKLIEWMR